MKNGKNTAATLTEKTGGKQARQRGPAPNPSQRPDGHQSEIRAERVIGRCQRGTPFVFEEKAPTLGQVPHKENYQFS